MNELKKRLRNFCLNEQERVQENACMSFKIDGQWYFIDLKNGRAYSTHKNPFQVTVKDLVAAIFTWKNPYKFLFSFDPKNGIVL